MTRWLFDDATVPAIHGPLPGPKAVARLERYDRLLSPSYTPVYPLVVARASGAVIEDVDGNLFLDFTAGIAVTNTGHCHPAVTAAIVDQAAKLIHMSGTDFYYDPQIDLAERLAALAPVAPGQKRGAWRVFFSNSGAESIDGALKLARHHTGRSRVIAFYGSFHGRTYGAMSLSASKLVHRRGFGPLLSEVHHVPYPKGCGECLGGPCACVRTIEETLLKRVAPPDEVAAIFVEPIQGEGGYNVPPRGFLPALRELCDKHGILLVVDEIQSGMGRTGKLFAVEHSGVVPDVLCLAKGIASGLPLGAILARAEVMSWPPGSHASTFGGNPVACRAGLVTLDLLQQGMMANASERGEQLRAGLRRLAARHADLGEVRGLGLMTAVDVRGREAILHRAFQRGLLLLGCGESAIRFCPPLCVTAAQVETALDLFDAVLSERSQAVVAGV